MASVSLPFDPKGTKSDDTFHKVYAITCEILRLRIFLTHIRQWKWRRVDSLRGENFHPLTILFPRILRLMIVKKRGSDRSFRQCIMPLEKKWPIPDFSALGWKLANWACQKWFNSVTRGLFFLFRLPFTFGSLRIVKLRNCQSSNRLGNDINVQINLHLWWREYLGLIYKNKN